MTGAHWCCCRRGVTLSGLSKAWGLAGLRLGWLATTNAAVLQRAADLKDYTSICAGTPNECLGLMALRAREHCWARCNGIIAANLAVIESFAAEHAKTLEWAPPLAGPVAFPRLRGSRGEEGGVGEDGAAGDRGVSAAEHCERLLSLEGGGAMLIPEGRFRVDATAHAVGGEGVADSRVRVGLGRIGMPAALPLWSRVLRGEDLR